MKNSPTTKAAGITSAAVQRATGKSWDEWFAALDKARAAEQKWNHTAIARHLYDKLKCSGWWSQMIANGYEQVRGLRVKHQMSDGFKINKSATIAAPVAKVYALWADPKARSGWLNASNLVIRKATPNKSLRITWADGKTHVEALFHRKAPSKCMVVVQHSKLANAKTAERMKAYWGGKLSRLKDRIES